MEKSVRLVEQFPLRCALWTSKNGDKRVIKSVELRLSDGVDDFIGEVNDDLAEALAENPLKKDYFYGIQARLSVSEWTKQDNSVARATRIRILKIQPY
jgi:hypothetical protein